METNTESTDVARRAFLAKCGKYAFVTPPAVTLMLSASARDNYAVALSGSFESSHHGEPFFRRRPPRHANARSDHDEHHVERKLDQHEL